MNWLAFANPWMLAGLAAAGLPVLIHYLTRARPRRIAFPPFKFLVEACAGQQSVHRLRTLVLLILRCLAVLALVLLFARPYLKPSISPAAAQANKRVVIVLDASLSMRAVQRGVTLFARAQADAAEVLSSLASGSEAAVILAGATPQPLLPALSRNLPALHDELVKAQPTFEEGDPGAALALARKMLGGTGTIYVFEYPDHSAALTLSVVGRGAVAYINMPVTPDGGNFVGSPMFPATVHELLRALRRSSAGRPITPGANWALDVPAPGEGALTVTDPEGHAVNAQVLSSGRTTRLALSPVRLPGAYAVKQAGTMVEWVAVNVDPRESDTRPLALERLKAGAGSTVAVVQGDQDEFLGNKPRPLWPQLAAAVALFLALEMVLLAWWPRRVPSGDRIEEGFRGENVEHPTSNIQHRMERGHQPGDRSASLQPGESELDAVRTAPGRRPALRGASGEAEGRG